MKGIPFLKKDIGKISAIIDSIDMLSDNSYTWITSLADNKSWCTEKTRDLFRLTDQVISDFEHLLLEYVYPDDVQEYLEEIENRLNGIHLDWGLCIRMRINDEQYTFAHIYFYCFFTSRYPNEFAKNIKSRSMRQRILYANVGFSSAVRLSLHPPNARCLQ